MKKYVLAAGLALATLGLGTSSNAAVITVNLDSTRTAVTLVTGVGPGLYDITVRGRVTIARGTSTTPARLADAEYQQQLGTLNWVDLTSNGTDVGVEVNGQAINWGAFNSLSPVYTIRNFQSAATQMSLLFRDSNYSDNRGFLTVEITPVPLPASMLGLLAGLAGLAFLRRRKTV